MTARALSLGAGGLLTRCCALSVLRTTGTPFFLVTSSPGRARKGKANSGERDRKIKCDSVKGRTLWQPEAKASYLSVGKFRKRTSFDYVKLKKKKTRWSRSWGLCFIQWTYWELKPNTCSQIALRDHAQEVRKGPGYIGTFQKTNKKMDAQTLKDFC